MTDGTGEGPGAIPQGMVDRLLKMVLFIGKHVCERDSPIRSLSVVIKVKKSVLRNSAVGSLTVLKD